MLVKFFFKQKQKKRKISIVKNRNVGNTTPQKIQLLEKSWAEAWYGEIF
jgi:hypothetical protein